MSTPRFARLQPLVVAAVATALLLAQPLAAQYFGQNQVQWQKFDFHQMTTEHFVVYHYPQGNPAAADAARMAERWYARYSEVWDHEFREKKPIILYNDHADFQQTPVGGGGLIGEGTGGFTEPFRDRVVLPMTPSYAETDHVLGHELVHVFQFDVAQSMRPSGQQSGDRAIGLQSLPLWFVEGLAEYLSQGRNDTLTSSWMRDAVIHDDLPTLEKMTRDQRYNPYQYGQAVWAYIGGRWGDRTTTELFKAGLRVGPESAFPQVLGMDWKQFAEEWHRDVKAYYQPLLAQRQKPAEIGTELVGKKEGGRLAISPVLSPDGRYLAFLSSRELFSVDLYLADAATGRVIRRLASEDTDPHFDELRFVESAGAWSPDGKSFAFPVVTHGSNSIDVVNVDTGRFDRLLKVPVGEVNSLAWSPDGRSIAFSGQQQGIADLYLYDLASKQSTKLTDDAFSDLQPSFTPDGRALLFVSDRGPGADLAQLRYAPLSLYRLDIASKGVTPVQAFDGVREIDPHMSADGKWIYFLADPDGVSDVYRIAAGGGTPERLTHVATGIGGITDKSPALSVGAERIVFSVFDDRGLDLRSIPVSTPPSPAPGTDRQAAVLPPAENERQSSVEQFLARGGAASAPREYPLGSYKPKMSLEYMGPISVGLYGDRYGYGAGGDVTAYFSDQLNRHELGVSLMGGSTSTSLQNAFGLEALYFDRTSRFNWGAGGAHIPTESAFTTVSTRPVDVDGETVLADVYQQVREVQTVDQVSLIGQYPLSQSRRFEASAVYARVSFDDFVDTAVVVGDQVIDESTNHIPSAPAFNQVATGLAFVGDDSSWGFISPVRGGRMRLEVDHSTGSADFNAGLLDARKYFFFRPTTIAMRGMFLGRYGQDAESGVLSPLYIGQDTLVRGYPIENLHSRECTPQPGGSACPEQDRLIGSKIAVANLEVRVPLFGVEGYGLIHLPALPTELAFFADAGAAWTQNDNVRWVFDPHAVDRVPVVSTGVAARILLLGALPLEFYYAKPFQRPREGAVFGFLITPGW